MWRIFGRGRSWEEGGRPWEREDFFEEEVLPLTNPLPFKNLLSKSTRSKRSKFFLGGEWVDFERKLSFRRGFRGGGRWNIQTSTPAALFAQTTDESFRPPFSKGGTDPTPWGVGRPPQRTKYPYRSKEPERGSKSSDLRGAATCRSVISG